MHTAVRCSRFSRESSRFHSREIGNEKVRESRAPGKREPGNEFSRYVVIGSMFACYLWTVDHFPIVSHSFIAVHIYDVQIGKLQIGQSLTRHRWKWRRLQQNQSHGSLQPQLPAVLTCLPSVFHQQQWRREMMTAGRTLAAASQAAPLPSSPQWTMNLAGLTLPVLTRHSLNLVPPGNAKSSSAAQTDICIELRMTFWHLMSNDATYNMWHCMPHIVCNYVCHVAAYCKFCVSLWEWSVVLQVDIWTLLSKVRKLIRFGLSEPKRCNIDFCISYQAVVNICTLFWVQ